MKECKWNQSNLIFMLCFKRKKVLKNIGKEKNDSMSKGVQRNFFAAV